MSNPSGPHTGQVWKGVNTGCAVRGVLIGQGTDPVAVVQGGTSGQVLTNNGPNSDPTWQDGGSGAVPSTLSGAQTKIETETLGVVVSDNGGNTGFVNFTLYGGNNLVAVADSLNVFGRVGGLLNVSAAGMALYATAGGMALGASGGAINMVAQGPYSAIKLQAFDGPISLTPSNATQAIHLQNRVSADDWPSADPHVSGRLWQDPATNHVIKMSVG